MLSEILTHDLNVVFVGTTIGETSDDLGFYYLGQNNKFWFLLEYAGLTPTAVITPSERKVLVNAKKDGVLDDMYRQLYFEKKENQLLKQGIGLTDLNRRVVVSSDDDPSAAPTPEDVKKFVRKVEKFKPKIVAFVTGMDIFEKSMSPLFPPANRQRGKQEFLIGESEVWLLGSTSGRVKDTDALEQVFEDLAGRLHTLNTTTV